MNDKLELGKERFKVSVMKGSWVLGLLLISMQLAATDLTGVINSHDPSTLIEENGRYYHFTTGDGIWYSYSDDLVHWTPGPSTVFPVGTWPAWINSEVPGFAGHFWAPDIIQMNGYYYLYYSVSTFGSSRSAIGVARTSSLSNPNWQDLGMVVDSNGGTNEINAIDAALIRDTDGRVYMSYGSWFGGIAVVEINTNTGKTIGTSTWLYGGGHQSIEAPYIIKKGSYYYLYVNHGTCCQGLNSTYEIHVGRAISITGPYSGFQPIISSSGKYVGPGHVGLTTKGACEYVSIHYYDGNDNGNAKLDILKLSYANGWPQFTRNFAFSDCPNCSPSSITPYAQVDGGSWSQTGSVTVQSGQSVKFGPHPTQGGSWSWSGPNGFAATSREITISNASASQSGAYEATYTNSGGCQTQYGFSITVNGAISNGVYHLTNKGSGMSWDSWGCTGNQGEPIAQANYAGYTCQNWQITDVGNNQFSIASTISGNVADVSGCSPNAGALVQLWSDWGGDCQKFEFAATGDGDGSYYITSVNGGKAVGVPQYSGTGQQAQMQDLTGHNWQKWYVISSSGARYGEALGEEAQALASEFSLYPNPAQGDFKVNLSSPVSGPIEITMFGLDGQIKRDLRFNLVDDQSAIAIERNGLKSGVYILKVAAGEVSSTTKLVLK